MSLGLILAIILVIFLLGGFSGRFGGPGYGYGHRGNGLIGGTGGFNAKIVLRGPAPVEQTGRPVVTRLRIDPHDAESRPRRPS